MKYVLRPYQQEAVQRTVSHFKQSDEAALIVLPTGAGKSLVIAELARIAKQKILVLAHVKELVEQNAQKYISFGFEASIFSAGLKQKSLKEQVTFASVQSLARNTAQLSDTYSLLIIDECHRVSGDDQSQYGQVISSLKKQNPRLKVLGLTATPFRMGMGWVYHHHYHGFVRGDKDAPFKKCIFELPLRYMIKHGYLTPPHEVDAAISHYDFSSLPSDSFGRYSAENMNALLKDNTRATKAIIEQVIDYSEHRHGVMIFAATVMHAKEIVGYLPTDNTALITGDTDNNERDTIINQFKAKKLKFLVNVSVLTTGFDAPHVDFIAILRPTESVSLYQQIVGRGLRLSEGKKECLVIDYAGNGFDLFYPEVGSKKAQSDNEPVQVLCPGCGFANIFWGKTDAAGNVIEHFGRRCQGLLDDDDGTQIQCDYRFRFKECEQCGEQNDIAARQCQACSAMMTDPDDKLREALNLKDALVLRCSGLSAQLIANGLLKISYFDEDGASCDEVFNLSNDTGRFIFNKQFGRRAQGNSAPITWKTAEQVIEQQHVLVAPDFVIARKNKKYGWKVAQKLFDYQGNYRKANQLK
ncbi:carboxylate--amine ligase [Pseudoalteromonas lipolytica SCSIO 04301]|jgi:DNA repair protein RadD|uniref:ATP-dependent helicase IRC3 n=1 Tax=Pseudoalteromonas lipolytica TaxID=570156 RepID=A0ABY1GPE3_9GAMM|nr:MULTISPECIES: DEAD/DEAH box helicase [Pseudoalteromonas]EWH06737.1 carboxylate--amine ligase [Pseudoalteromonas lipolytica SCSIO 04301]MBE0351280.1 ATP-dependent helicase IRC3 [Pseudoalteromonas lipolytica LMEB 39]QLJ09424.1 DEAD/DEAH box helicase [Pseudoalteromonas sp. JSTW]QMW15628.1 DEAD/DEAH box helicase [Pseudoalteromonas sp. MT33b]QPL44010.1 DEAD/DEAH box helicase [Pseudoalteromonas sp. A41-2]